MHGLVHLLNSIYPIRRRLLLMLRPMDIVALVKATGIQMTDDECHKHMVLWKQFFFNMTWVEELAKIHCTVTIIGQNVGRLHTAITTWDHTLDATNLKFAVAIGEKESTETRPYARSQELLAAFDATTSWSEVPTFDEGSINAISHPFRIDTSPENTQICVLSMREGGFADLSHLWSPVLSLPTSPLASYVNLQAIWPFAVDAWSTEWQILKAGDYHFRYIPTRMHYLVDLDNLKDYQPRIFVGRGGICGLTVMRHLGE